MSQPHTFGDLLKQTRKRIGMTQGDLAAAVGYSISFVCALEQNRRLPDVDIVLQQFVPALGLQEEPKMAARLVELAAAARGERPPVAITRQRETQIVVTDEITEGVVHLPASPTQLLGRDQEVRSLGHRLLGHTGRLLTLVGPPGIGKTTLALAVAAHVQPHYPDGAVFVPLAAISDPALTASAIIGALGGDNTSPKPPETRLIECLRRKTILLVLDNCEQIVGAGSLIAAVLAACPGVCMLATSRERLHLRAEQRYRVLPLELAAAVDLFTQRAATVDADFMLTAENRPLIEAICQRLDRLPLALELCATQVDLLSPAQLLTHLQEKSLDLLVNGAHDLPPQQRTLRNAIHHSYRLLNEAERMLFRSLGVFVGRFDLSAVEIVSAWRQEPGTLSLRSTLHALIGKSLVHPETLPTGEQHFLLLETIREFALEQLTAGGELSTMQQRHARYYLACVTHSERDGDEPQRRIWLNRLELDRDNLRSALRWWLSHDGAQAAELAMALYDFWFTRGHLSEGRRAIAEVLAVEPLSLRQRAYLLLYAAHLAQNQDEHREATAQIAQSLACFRQLDDPGGMAEALRVQGWCFCGLGALEQARHSFEASLALFRQLGNETKVAMQAVDIADIYLKETRYDEARVYLQAGLTAYRQLNRLTDVAHLLCKQGQLEAETGNYATAVSKLEEALALFRHSGSQHIGWPLSSLGYAYSQQGNLVQARACYQEAYTLFCEQRGKLGMLVLQHHLGALERLVGNHDLALDYHRESLRLAVAQENLAMIARNLASFGAIALAQQKLERAAGLLAAAQYLFDTLPPFLSAAEYAAYQQLIADTRQVLGDELFTRIWNEWRTRSREEAIAYSLFG